jgi:hypothetical protein
MPKEAADEDDDILIISLIIWHLYGKWREEGRRGTGWLQPANVAFLYFAWPNMGDSLSALN